MEAAEIRDLFAKHNVSLDRDDVWKVQAAVVVKHKALERLAGGLRIIWDAPVIIRAERDEAVILATGRLPDGPAEWSIGECLQTDGTMPGNYRVSGKQAPYVYAMAEKRAKDRVILKLAGLHGAYSEDEADDFKSQPEPERAPPPAKGAPAPVTVTSGPPPDESQVQYEATVWKALRGPWSSAAELMEWWQAGAAARRAFDLKPDLVAQWKAKVIELRDGFARKEAA